MKFAVACMSGGLAMFSMGLLFKCESDFSIGMAIFLVGFWYALFNPENK